MSDPSNHHLEYQSPTSSDAPQTTRSTRLVAAIGFIFYALLGLPFLMATAWEISTAHHRSIPALLAGGAVVTVCAWRGIAAFRQLVGC